MIDLIAQIPDSVLLVAAVGSWLGICKYLDRTHPAQPVKEDAR